MIRKIDSSNIVQNLNQLEKKIHSQNGEDGIIEKIFDTIKPTNQYCIEFGIHPNQGNTIQLANKNWNYLWIDANGDGQKIKKEFITAENIESIFVKYNAPTSFDLLSIDVDYNDYWIWKSIRNYRPRVVIIEYNSSIPYDEKKVAPYDPNMVWDGTNFFGASLLALNELGKSKGYTLIACDNKGVNAFFILSDLATAHFKLYDLKNIYKPPGYGIKTSKGFIGHPFKAGNYVIPDI